MGRDSYANAVVRGGNRLEVMQDNLPTVRVYSIGNGWLYKSVVATLIDQRTHDLWFESLTSKIKGLLAVRRLGIKKVLISFTTEEDMRRFLVEHSQKKSSWFSNVCPRSVTIDLELWERGVVELLWRPVHAWNISTLREIGEYWGEVLNVDEDTAKCVRCDIGKIKIFTQNAMAINNQMRLVVGGQSFVIRVAEEQAVFICNSNFNCQCACHGVGKDQTQSSGANEEDDDVEDGEGNKASDDGNDSWQSFIAETQTEGDEERTGARAAIDLGEVEMRGSGQLMAWNEELNLGTRILGIDPLRVSSEEQRVVDKGKEGNGQADEGIQEAGLAIGPGLQNQLMNCSGPVFNRSGICLEVVLDSEEKEEGCNNDIGKELQKRADCGPTIPGEDSAGTLYNQYRQSLSVTNQRSSAGVRILQIQQSNGELVGNDEVELVLPNSEERENPRKRGRPRKKMTRRGENALVAGSGGQCPDSRGKPTTNSSIRLGGDGEGLHWESPSAGSKAIWRLGNGLESDLLPRVAERNDQLRRMGMDQVCWLILLIAVLQEVSSSRLWWSSASFMRYGLGCDEGFQRGIWKEFNVGERVEEPEE
ncbi:hypothetical protein Dimus_028151 [Dionaea muscipula]